MGPAGDVIGGVSYARRMKEISEAR